MKPFNLKEAIIYKEQLNHDGRYHRPDYHNTIPWEEKGHINTSDSSAVRGHFKDELTHMTVNKKSILIVTVNESVSKMMWQLLNQQSTPDIDTDIFSGNPMDFHYFMAVFNKIVEKRVDDIRGKLTLLIKYTAGDAREMTKNCIQLPPEIGFETAKQLFDERYADPYRNIAAYKKEIKY